MSRERLLRTSLGFTALAAVALVGACTPRTTAHEESSTRTAYSEDSAEGLEARYRAAGEAQTRYEDCMTRFIPDYREQVAEYGEVFLGGGDSGVPAHPALEGCRAERQEYRRLQRLAFGYRD